MAHGGGPDEEAGPLGAVVRGPQLEQVVGDASALHAWPRVVASGARFGPRRR